MKCLNNIAKQTVTPFLFAALFVVPIGAIAFQASPSFGASSSDGVGFVLFTSLKRSAMENGRY